MNRYLANYLFSNETLFVLPKSYPEVVSQNLEQKTTEVETVESVDYKIVKEAIGISNLKETIPDLKEIDSLKDVIVIVKALNSDQKDLLLKILSSVKLSFENISLIEISSKTITISELIKKSKHPKLNIINFGVAFNKTDLDLSVFPYQLKNEGKIGYLLIDSLEIIDENKKEEKRLLWIALKQMFIS